MRMPSVAGLVVSACLFGCSAMPEPKAAPADSAGGSATTPGATSAMAAQKPGKKAGTSEVEQKDADATGSLSGDDAADSFGQGGLGLVGVGEGGGGAAEGGVGLGKVGTIGHGSGTGTGQGYGSGTGRMGGTSAARGKVAAATATTAGSGLPPEIIQRIIRANVNQIRLCYENAMTKAPALAGKVAVSFTIGTQGTVTSATASDTNISDADMVTCVLSAVKRMSFPAPDGGGSVNVTYPFNFSPGDS